MKQAYVDTNVILRFLTGDPADLATQARALFDAVEGGEITLVVDEIVIAETVWVLQSFYGYPPAQVSRVVQQLLTHDGLHMANKPALLAALSLYADKNVDLADALLAVRMQQHGVHDIFSFDRHFDHLPGVVRHTPGHMG
jgi:predicted nucleic-acid-binding protein